jgi:hypothetical protein
MAAFLAHMRHGDAKMTDASIGIMKQTHRQFPGLLAKMLVRSPIEARAQAKRLGIPRQPGQTYMEAGIVNVTPEMDAGVAVLAGKLTKAIYYQRTGKVFPTDGAIQFQWFTNAEKAEHGRIVALAAVARYAALSAPISRSGKDLKDQFDYRYAADASGALHVLQVLFGDVFGFVSIASNVAGQLEDIETRVASQLEAEGVSGTPSWTWLSGGPKPIEGEQR